MLKVHLKDLEVKSPLNKIYWIRFDLPFFMSDRDYVLEINSTMNNQSRELLAQIKSVEHPEKGIDNCCVRARAYGTFYRFLAKGQKTFLEVEVHTDPKGWIPAWLINLIQKRWPKKTLQALITTAQGKDIVSDPRFTSWERL